MYHLYPKLITKEYKNINSAIPNINKGGCGVFAEELYNVFKELGNKPKIIVLARNTEYMRECIANPEKGVGFLHHIVIKVGKYYYDSNGKFNTLNDIIVRYNYNPNISGIDCSFKTLTYWNSRVEFWNDIFDRDYIPGIKNRLNTAKEKILNKIWITEF